MRLNLLQEIDPMILECAQVIIRLVLEQTESINGELVSDNEAHNMLPAYLGVRKSSFREK